MLQFLLRAYKDYYVLVWVSGKLRLPLIDSVSKFSTQAATTFYARPEVKCPSTQGIFQLRQSAAQWAGEKWNNFSQAHYRRLSEHKA